MSDGPPKTLREWIDYLHAAAKVAPGSPDYRDSREAIAFAGHRIHGLLTAQGVQEDDADYQSLQHFLALNPGLAPLLGGLQGASFGTGEPIAGLASAVSGGSFRQGAQNFREGLENLETASPEGTVGGELAGGIAASAIPVGKAIESGTDAAKAIVQGGGIRKLGVLPRFLSAAARTDITPGLALGGLQGFSQGGADPGDLGARLTGGVKGAATGAILQAALAGLGGLRASPYRVRPSVGPVADALPEIPAELARRADVQQALDDFHAGTLDREGLNTALEYAQRDAQLTGPRTSAARTSTNAPPRSGDQPFAGRADPTPQSPPEGKLRPGEAAHPIPGSEGRGIEITGRRATPAPPAAPTISELLGRSIPSERTSRVLGGVTTSTPFEEDALFPEEIAKDPVARALAEVAQNPRPRFYGPPEGGRPFEARSTPYEQIYNPRRTKLGSLRFSTTEALDAASSQLPTEPDEVLRGWLTDEQLTPLHDEIRQELVKRGTGAPALRQLTGSIY